MLSETIIAENRGGISRSGTGEEAVMNDELFRLHDVHVCTEWASGKSPEICVAV